MERLPQLLACAQSAISSSSVDHAADLHINRLLVSMWPGSDILVADVMLPETQIENGRGIGV